MIQQLEKYSATGSQTVRLTRGFFPHKLLSCSLRPSSVQNRFIQDEILCAQVKNIFEGVALGCIQNLKTNQFSLVIEINVNTLANLHCLGNFLFLQIDIYSVGFPVIFKFHVSFPLPNRGDHRDHLSFMRGSHLQQPS